jgi:hypothetical protein
LGDIELRNRIVMSPMTRSRALGGNVPNPIAMTYYAQRASAGVIVTEATQVSPQGVGYLNARDSLARAGRWMEKDHGGRTPRGEHHLCPTLARWTRSHPDFHGGKQLWRRRRWRGFQHPWDGQNCDDAENFVRFQRAWRRRDELYRLSRAR